MKSFLIGIGGFAAISAVVYGTLWVLQGIGFSDETISTLGLLVVLLAVAKPFGELTQSVFNLDK